MDKNVLSRMFITVREHLKNLWAREFVRGLAVTIANRGLLIVLGMVSSVLVARGLGPEARGEYAYIVSVLMIAGQFSLLGLHGANVVFASRDPKLGGALLGNSLLTAIVLGTLTCIGLWIWDTFLQNSLLHLFLFLLFATIILQAALCLTQQLALGLGSLKAYNFTELLPAVIGPVCIAFAFFAKQLTVLFLVVVGVLMAAAGLIVALHGVWCHLPGKKLQCSFILFKDCFQYGWRVYISCILINFLSRLEFFVAEGHISNDELGQYAIAFATFTMSIIPAQVLGSLLLPKLSSVDEAKRGVKLFQIILITAPLFAGIAFVLYFISPWIIPFFYGSAYQKSVDLYSIMLLGYVPVCITALLSSFIGTWNLNFFFLLSFFVLVIVKGLVFFFYSHYTASMFSYVYCFFNFVFFIIMVVGSCVKHHNIVRF